jgi:hypothetical protein
LCAPTGGGKSITSDSFAAGQGNVSWCILPLLSLGADQVIKINQNLASGDGAVVAFHLDHYRHPAQQQAIAKRVANIRGNSKTTVCITSSPQALLNNTIYYSLYCHLLQKDLLMLLTVDKLQLFVQFGQQFRNEFFALKCFVAVRFGAVDCFFTRPMPNSSAFPPAHFSNDSTSERLPKLRRTKVEQCCAIDTFVECCIQAASVCPSDICFSLPCRFSIMSSSG